MKKAIQIGYDELFEKKCRFAREAGFDAISLNFSDMINKTEYDWDKALEDVQRILEENKIKCVQTHPYYYPLETSSEIVEEECEFAIKQTVIASGKLGAAWCALHPRTSITSGYLVKKSLEDNKRVFSEYLELAHKFNTGLAAENLPIFAYIMPVKPFYSSNYEDLCELVDAINDEKMKICWDTGHANLMHANQGDAIKYVGGRIKCTHVHNNNGRADLHLPPDCGNIRWNEVMTAMKSIGYDGYYTLETHCMYPEDQMLRNFARFNYEGLEYLERVLERGTLI